VENPFAGAERRKQCAEWDAHIAGAINCVQKIEDILFQPLERHIRRNFLAALSSFLRALELQLRYLLKTKVDQKTEIRVELGCKSKSGRTPGYYDRMSKSSAPSPDPAISE
jgi:hypothetical protein